MRSKVATLSLTSIAAVLLSMAATGAAYAVSGGGFVLQNGVDVSNHSFVVRDAEAEHLASVSFSGTIH